MPFRTGKESGAFGPMVADAALDTQLLCQAEVKLGRDGMDASGRLTTGNELRPRLSSLMRALVGALREAAAIQASANLLAEWSG